MNALDEHRQFRTLTVRDHAEPASHRHPHRAPGSERHRCWRDHAGPRGSREEEAKNRVGARSFSARSRAFVPKAGLEQHIRMKEFQGGGHILSALRDSQRLRQLEHPMALHVTLPRLASKCIQYVFNIPNVCSMLIEQFTSSVMLADMSEHRHLPSRREEYTEATRQALLSAGRDAFARDGYQAAGIEAISRAARVTRGAFYHHFEDKKALFDAVVVALQAEAAAKIEKGARAEGDLGSLECGNRCLPGRLPGACLWTRRRPGGTGRPRHQTLP